MKRTTRIARLNRLCQTGEAREIRIRAGVSLALVAEEAGTPYAGTVSRWENGKRAPKGDAALRYLEVLDELAGVAAPDPMPRAAAHVSISRAFLMIFFVMAAVMGRFFTMREASEELGGTPSAETLYRLVADHHVIYADFEDGPESTVERLRALGVTSDQISARLTYLNPGGRFDELAQAVIEQAIAARGLRLWPSWTE
jgi:transcriptional regulator with XRE-family HTH domain